ncbi:MAG TPA: DUF488 family protein [Gemmata sp.]|nr:DUF488 family protein [Gemmata sp.]
MIRLKRAYEKPSADDGLRVLVERLWPRGVSKENGKIDLWLKELSPSTELRKWFSHEESRWPEFQKRYHAELKEHEEMLALLKLVVESRTVTFIYAASDEERNSARLLKEYLEKRA